MPTTRTKIVRDGKLAELRTRDYQVSPTTTASLCQDCRLVALPMSCAKSHLSHSEYRDMVNSHDGQTEAMTMTNTTTNLTQQEIDEIVAAAAVCAKSGYDVSRRLRTALRSTPVAADAEDARISGAKAGPQPYGAARPAPTTAVERVWCYLDRGFGPAITRAMY